MRKRNVTFRWDYSWLLQRQLSHPIETKKKNQPDLSSGTFLKRTGKSGAISEYVCRVRQQFLALFLKFPKLDTEWKWSKLVVSGVKASACNAGDLGSIPGSGRSPGEGNGNPLQYSCLENPMDRGAWWAIVHGVAKSRTRLSDFTSLHFFITFNS